MSNEQKHVVLSIFSDIVSVEFHHGDCIGADTDAHNIYKEVSSGKIIIHPPINEIKRSFCEDGVVLESKEYLARNHDIVDASNIMIACPSSKIEQVRSGTWATIGYSKKKNKKIYIIFPDGSMERNGFMDYTTNLIKLLS